MRVDVFLLCDAFIRPCSGKTVIEGRDVMLVSLPVRCYESLESGLRDAGKNCFVPMLHHHHTDMQTTGTVTHTHTHA
jgi:hypothetical protein